MTTAPYDQLPLAARRANWGWFGEPWPSGICYDDDDRLLTEMRKPVPVGEDCTACGETFQAGDQGKTCGALGAADGRPPRLAHMHKECLLRAVTGPLAHLQRRCRCYGGTDHDTPGFTRRQEAQAVWAWTQAHGVQ